MIVFMPFRTLSTITGDYQHPSCEFFFYFRSGACDVSLLVQCAAPLGTNRSVTRRSILQERTPQPQSTSQIYKLQYNSDWMKIRRNVRTYVLLKVPMSSCEARLVKDFKYWHKLPCGSLKQNLPHNLSSEKT